MIRDSGAELFIFSSDHVHPEGTNDPKPCFERTMGGPEEDDVDRFYRRDFEQMMSLACARDRQNRGVRSRRRKEAFPLTSPSRGT
jgi:hypothetical protein